MTTVLVSDEQSHSDFATVAELELERAEYEAWLDQFGIRASDDCRSKIHGTLASASALIAGMNPETVASQFVIYKWPFALIANFRIEGWARETMSDGEHTLETLGRIYQPCE